MIDLAGSERIAKSGAAGQRLQACVWVGVLPHIFYFLESFSYFLFHGARVDVYLGFSWFHIALSKSTMDSHFS
jgi:hypothetical protein